jgi:MFS transporter, DHA1 family, multidrug resistance protein
MHQRTSPAILRARRFPSFLEFVCIVALMMGYTAFAVDNLLPAFPAIGTAFAVADPNELQLLVTIYMLGFGLMQLVYGAVSDTVGRRPALLVGLAVFGVGCVLALVATDMNTLLAARFIQGMGAAAGRVLAIAIVRDRYDGREMARVMSLAIGIFIIVPVFAPAIGGVLLLFGNWHMIFIAMFLLALVVAAWFGLRMPETLHEENRAPLSVRRIARGMVRTMTTRVSIGYATAFALGFACTMSYVGSAEQIFGSEVYELGSRFPIVFGTVAGISAIAAFMNSRLVGRYGMRMISHVSILALVALSLVQVGVSWGYQGRPPLLLFGAILAASQFLVTLAVPNFNALAMVPLGAIAGTASSVIGFYTTVLGSMLGLLVGQAFNGTVIPLGVGYLALSVATVAVILWTERGVMFRSKPAA